MNIRMIRPRPTLALTLGFAIVAAGCARPADTAAPASTAVASPAAGITVDVATAALAEIPVVVEASGSVEAWQRAAPASKLMARVLELTARDGDRVFAGQVIARLESADLEAAVAQAQAALVMAEATLENAATQHGRMEQLHAERSVTDKNLEDATAAHRVAAANVEVARANVEAADVMRSYAVVRTPIAGWVTQKLIDLGDMATPGSPLLIVDDLSRVKVKVNVPESVVARLALGQAADVSILGQTYAATINRMVPAGDPASRTFAVEMVVDNPDGVVKAGMFARATFATALRSVILLPQSAVVARGQLTGLFVVDSDNRALLRWITLGPPVGDDVEVLSGLRAGEQYVVEPGAEMHDGATVAVAR